MDKIAVYTAIFGNHSGLVPQPNYGNVDYICFTDSKISARGWDIRKVDLLFNDPSRSNRFYKINPHLHLKDYDISVYIDSNVLVINNPEWLVEHYMQNVNMLGYDHRFLKDDQRDCIYKEHQHILDLGERTGRYKDNEEVMQEQMQRYRDEGFPPNYGLLHGAILIRRHNCKDVIDAMETWWQEVKNSSRRDQLSFNYAAWKNDFKFGHIPGDPRSLNPWFFKLGSKRKSYTKKILQYRFKKFWADYAKPKNSS